MSYDIDPEKRAEMLETAALGGTEEINGITLRPMTYGTYSLIQRIKNAAGESGASDFSFTIAACAYIHSQPVEKLRTHYARPSVLIEEIFDFMNSRPVADFAAWMPWVGNQMEQFNASITQASSSYGDGDEQGKV
jgi:hypothetical protein